MYFYGCVSPCVCCVSVCVISNQSTSKKPHYVSDLSKLDALLHKTQQGTKARHVYIHSVINVYIHSVSHSAKKTRQQRGQ